jgi:uncharacterized protein (TIGR00251 family)
MAVPWTVAPDGLLLVVRLTPKGGRDAIEGIDRLADGSSVLKARVRAAAHDGEANAGLIRLLARSVGVAPRDVSIAAGTSARIKRLMIAGQPLVLAATLEKICKAR